MTGNAPQAAGIASLTPASYHNWKAQVAILEQFRITLNVSVPSQGRDRYVAALKAIVPIISTISDEQHDDYTIQHEVSSALEELIEILQDLNRGIVDPAIRPERRFGGNYASIHMRRTAENARSAYKCLIARGDRSQLARKLVAKVLGVTEVQVKNWATRGRLPRKR
jgi:hypothetical protein